MKKVLWILVLGLLLNGCATVKPTGGLYKETALETGKSKIIVLRKGGSLISADIPKIKISNSKEDFYSTHYLPSKSYIQIEANPGSYTIYVGAAPTLVWRFDPFEVDVNVRKNETIFLELITWSIGYVSRAKIETVDKEYASDKLKSLQRTLSSDVIQ